MFSDTIASDQSLQRKLMSDVFGRDFIFDFRNKDSVFLDPSFGLKFFGDSIFKYSVTQKDIFFSNGETKDTIHYINDHGIYRLSINSNGVERISIIPSDSK